VELLSCLVAPMAPSSVVLFLAAVLTALASASFVNNKVTRRIDATKQFIRTSTSIAATASSASSVYHVALTSAEADSLVGLTAENDVVAAEKYAVTRDDKQIK
jgi:hypothetical protein